MTATVQWIAVALLVALAVVWLTRYAMKHHKDPCRGCAAAELCRKTDKKACGVDKEERKLRK